LIRTILMLTFWALALPVAALMCFPWTFLAGDISFLYRVAMWGAWTGVRLAGIRVQTVGLNKLDPKRTYVFMSNHVSNIDPPLMLPLIPRRTSVMVKKELFNYPILVLRQGINMMIYVEGHRSFDGRLLPFKKGPFYLAMECGVPIVPVTIAGSHYVMPKGRFAIRPGIVRVIFHEPIEPKDFGSRTYLMEEVRRVIDSGLPAQYREQQQNSQTTKGTTLHEGTASA